MDAKLSKIYCSPKDYWKGLAAVKKLKLQKRRQKNGSLNKPFGKYISQHHATFLGQSLMFSHPMQCTKQTFFFLPHDKLPHGKKVYKYALTVVDVASRYKAAEPLTSKESDEVSKAFQKIYRRGPLKWPQPLQVDPGREFMGAVAKVMENNKTAIRRGRTEIHSDQAIVERFNKTLAERVFGHQYAVEMRLTSGKRSTEWVKRLKGCLKLFLL